MRCNNCGWDNEKGKSQCIKCESQLFGGGPLLGSPILANKSTPFAGTITGKQLSPSLIQEPKTSANIQKDHSIDERKKPTPVSVLVACPHCGYPNAEEAQLCSDCAKSLSSPTNSEIGIDPTSQIETVLPTNLKVNEDTNLNEQPTQTDQPISKPKAFGDTIDIYRMEKMGIHNECNLELVCRENEIDAVHKFFKADEDSIGLNRETLDAENKTITSKVQAILSFEEGNWFLQDKSDQQTTFIRVAEKTALKEGDLILMGDRKFIFHINPPK